MSDALCLTAENAALDHIHGTAYTPASTIYLALSKAFSVVNSSYQWTASGSGTAEYYLEASGGGDPGLPDPEIMIENGTEMVSGTLGSLAAGEFGFGDNDSLGFNTVYVRLADDADPDSKADGNVMAGGNPGNDGSGLNEPGDTYARQAISFNAASGRQVVQAADVVFALSENPWGYVTHWAVCDAASGGNVLARYRFSEAREILADIRPKVLACEIWLQIDASSGGRGLTNYCANNLLDLLFRAGSFSVSGTDMALLSAAADDTAEDIGTDCTEMSGTGYSRITVNPAGGSSPAWSAAAGGEVNNADLIDWGTPGADDWSTLAGCALVTDAGKVLGYDNNIGGFTPSTSDSLQIDAGAYLSALD